MAQFQVYRLGGEMLVLDVQSDHIDTPTRVVAPLLPLDDRLPPYPKLVPVFEIGGRPHGLRIPDLAAVPEALLGEPVLDLRHEDYAIRRALDMIFTGF